MTEIANRDNTYKVQVRSQEFNHSAIRNIDICVAAFDSNGFPDKRLQCVFHGYDISGLEVQWISGQDFKIFMQCRGTVTTFSNYAIVYKDGNSVPERFHAELDQQCEKN